MAESERRGDLNELLKPFHQRASEAEVRLSRLEAAVGSNKNSGNEDILNMVSDLRSKLEDTKSKQAAEQEKAQKEIQRLEAENGKLQYRITHLIRALKSMECKSESESVQI